MSRTRAVERPRGTGTPAPAARRVPHPHERVLALQRTIGNRAVAQLARQATDAPQRPAVPSPFQITLPESCLRPHRQIAHHERVRNDPEARKVTLDDGSVFLVRRRRVIIPSERFEPLPPNISLGSDADRVWAQLDWCQGTRGTIQLGANPQQAANEALRALLDTINNGGTVQEALDAASRTNVTPFLDFDIGRSRAWRVSGQAEVNLNREGFQGATGRVDVQVGRIRIRPNITLDARGNPSGGGIDFVFGDAPPSFTCQRRQRLFIRQRTEYDFIPWIPEHDEPTETPWRRDVPSDYYVYFRRASDTVDSALSATQRAALVAELQRGGEVTGITAHTSPEGTHGARRGFQGNVRLAEQRAAAARTWVEQAIAEAGAGSIRANARVEGAEEPELHTLVDEQGRDVEGRPLESHATSSFGTSAAEERHRAEVEAELRRVRGGSRERAEVVYKRLRRAVITVVRTESGVTRGTRRVPGRWGTAREICNPVADADVARIYPRFDFN